MKFYYKDYFTSNFILLNNKTSFFFLKTFSSYYNCSQFIKSLLLFYFQNLSYGFEYLKFIIKFSTEDNNQKKL